MADNNKKPAAKSPDKKANRRGAARLAAVQALYQMDLAETSQAKLLRSIELLGTEVAPVLREIG